MNMEFEVKGALQYIKYEGFVVGTIRKCKNSSTGVIFYQGYLGLFTSDYVRTPLFTHTDREAVIKVVKAGIANMKDLREMYGR